ncbi:DUF167 domain-containing protein [Polynucleobacter sp. MWH-UH25E]|uniref:DUF167 domain-containing protein n=1 Tax=Polynucleobacter sp. MWH-UH25E TaxID=1855616 RepID=UPI001BFDB662|nr:DUF167 domain-containing protein [Polynucleobacter sp. MWH-UH25E]QWD62626.1 DUF167 domain-containing protein [Polynucleobacter sp. MWH-UH25E]
MAPNWLKQTPSGIITLSLHCQPGAKQTKVLGLHDDCLKIALQAPPLENKANTLLVAWLSKQLKIPQKQIQFISGQNNRRKRIEIQGDIDAEQIIRTLIPD